MHLFLKYAKSHIYEIHAVVCGTILFLELLLARKLLDSHFGKNNVSQKERNIVRLLILGALFIDGIILFYIISLISSMIEFSLFSAVFSSCVALFEISVYDQIFVKE
ncbi:MAG: hypothetical protein K6F84_06780 [Lachnospiraceae bacterium]|nr:hypothetical protein [Lachnospiraceae bacterium]